MINVVLLDFLMNKDIEYINKLRKQLLDKKESAPIPKKEPIEIVFEPEPDIKLAVDNTKKGLL